MENYRNRAKSENQFGKMFHSQSRLLNIFDNNDCAKRIRIRSKCEPNLKVNVKKLEDQFNSQEILQEYQPSLWRKRSQSQFTFLRSFCHEYQYKTSSKRQGHYSLTSPTPVLLNIKQNNFNFELLNLHNKKISEIDIVKENSYIKKPTSYELSLSKWRNCCLEKWRKNKQGYLKLNRV